MTIAQEYVPETAEEATHLRDMARLFAEGFPIEELRSKRIPGHPLVLGQEPAETVTVRLLPETITRLDAVSKKQAKTRSQIIREALDRELDLLAA